MKHEIISRIESFRKIMDESGIAAAIVPQTDPHQSEYLASHWQVRRFLSGFTGSAGTLVITASDALLWTDSRYFLQAADQLDGTGIKLMKIAIPGTPSIEEHLAGCLAPGQAVGIDGMLFSVPAAERLRRELEEHGIRLVTDFDVIDRLWTSRPQLPKDKIFVHDTKYTGESAESKLRNILTDAHAHGADAAFISPLDEIAWALNIRCRDVKYNPVVTAYLYVAPGGSVLLTDPEKVDAPTAAYLASQGVSIQSYAKVKEFLAALPADVKVLVDEATTSVTLATILGSRAVRGDSLVAVPKGCRNEVQIAGTKAAMVRDGVALVKAMKELEELLASGERVTELTVDALLLKHRSSQPLFFDESFGSIVGYGPHGAIVHYEPTPESDVELKPQGLLLIDSGAQYLDGTTDITRTISLGKPTAAERHDFTLVMKGHIALDKMVYPVGTRGAQLDVEARKYLWREGLGYLHGTGHGVGHFLNVHEGPQTIRLNNTETPLMEGMVTSNEPGLYRAGEYGVRCENLVLTVKAMTTEFGEFLKFETLTLYPFDLNLFDTSIMIDEEIEWVNDYHKKVYDTLSPHLDEAERAWLKQKTRTLSR